MLLFITFCSFTLFCLEADRRRNSISRYPLFDYIFPDRFIKSGIFSWMDFLYLGGLVPLFITTDFVLPIFFPKMEFFPLMLTSLYCAIGNFFCLFLAYLVVVARYQALDTFRIDYSEKTTD